MKCDIIISGVGGQGILSIATVLGRAALVHGLHIKQAEVHGMAQRGGAVQSHFRVSDGPVHSDVIPHAGADVVLAMEPMESLRYVGWLSPEGWLISNQEPVENIPDYPPPESIWDEVRKWRRHLLFNGSEIARNAGSARSVNMAVLGAGSPFIPIPAEELERAIEIQFQSKGEKVVSTNLDVFRAARKIAEEREAELK